MNTIALQISRVLHAGYILKSDQTQIAFDPIFENPFSVNCRAFPAVKFDREKIKKLRLDAVFISHYHDDHCSLQSLDLLDRSTPIYLYCLHDEMFSLIRSMGFTKVHPLKLDKAVAVGAFEVIPRRALDCDVDSLFQIRVADLNILNVVDSWIDPQTFAMLVGQNPWDLILWPFQTMQEMEVLSPSRASPPSLALPPEWMEQLQALKPRIVVPSSCQFLFEEWSWYNQVFFPISYLTFKTSLASILPSTVVLQVNPGQSYILDQNEVSLATSLEWIQSIGPQDTDYTYQPVQRPQKTSEIAQRLEPETPEHIQRVALYCQRDLLNKYSSLDEAVDPYFQKKLYWNLCTYDHHGNATNYYYCLEQNKIVLLKHKPQNLSWFTEVPLIKLYNALEKGEALTSMYVRINDVIFSAEIEKQISNVDILEDPLLRCLFTATFGAYQKYQLKKIQNLNCLKVQNERTQ